MANWTEEQIQEVWEKGTVVSGYDKNKYRKDQCEAWMSREEHGNRDSILGWEIDHIKTVSKGGTNAIGNLRPLQWNNNASRSDDNLRRVVTSEGRNNIFVEKKNNAA